mgnify:CR=1 FL=1
MEAHTKFDIAHAFVATSNDISKLWDIFQNYGLIVTATVSCADGLVRHFDSCESLVQYDNPARAAITSLEISARSRDPYATAEISLGARYSAPISISLRGEENAVSSMRTYVSDAVDGMRAWYSRIARIDFFYIWFPIFMVLFLLAQIMSPSGTPHPAMPLKKALELVAISTAVIGSIAAVIWAIAWLRKRFFPAATFAIGQGLSRHQHNEQVRWVVIVGFVVGVGASLAATILLA